MASTSTASSSTTDNKTLTLISSDGHEFRVSEAAAVLSLTLKNIIEEDCIGNPIPISNVRGEALAKVIEYLNKHSSGASEDEKKEFDGEWLNRTTRDLCDLIDAANYLDITCLLDKIAKEIAKRIKNDTVASWRELFQIENDFSPEEEEEERQKYAWAFN